MECSAAVAGQLPIRKQSRNDECMLGIDGKDIVNPMRILNQKPESEPKKQHVERYESTVSGSLSRVDHVFFIPYQGTIWQMNEHGYHLPEQG